MKPICMVRKSDGAVVARAARPEQVLEQDGNCYFHPHTVNRDLLEISDRMHDCPHKGRRYWVDLKDGKLYTHDVAWVYPDPKPEYRDIAGWFGFYPEHRSYRKTECA